VALADYVRPWSGVGYRHLPATVSIDKALDVSRAGVALDNRWNVAGEPTLYIAGDVGLAIVEWGRHYEEDRAPGLVHAAVSRTVYRLDVVIERAIDLRDPRLWADLSLADAPHCFLDKGVARTTAQFMRRASTAQAIVVPSMAMLDKPDRWNLVLFLEKLLPDLTLFIPHVTIEGPFRWR